MYFQIVGLTASSGIGRSMQEEAIHAYILKLCARLDSTLHIVTKETESLKEHMKTQNKSTQSIEYWIIFPLFSHFNLNVTLRMGVINYASWAWNLFENSIFSYFLFDFKRAKTVTRAHFLLLLHIFWYTYIRLFVVAFYSKYESSPTKIWWISFGRFKNDGNNHR